MSEATRIANLLKRAFDGEAWHGPGVLELLEDVNARTAAKRPGEDIHSIWEIVLHIAVWDHAAVRRLAGEVVQPPPAEDWPPITDFSEENWRTTKDHLIRTHKKLVDTVQALPDSRLDDQVPGKKPKHYNFYYMLHGIAQHELYHAGQIAVLKKM
ncbi:MAG TPA: DinB family protein [Terriglobales bacterium]|nr:DinB family protein [Terriglobales bacterium]